MGIKLSTILKREDPPKPKSPYEQFMARWIVLAEATAEGLNRELHDLFPPANVGDTTASTTDQQQQQPKIVVRDDDEDLEVTMRLFEFMKKGGCKESFKALEDCLDENDQRFNKCKHLYPRLNRCMHAHSDYYQPILALSKRCEDRFKKEMVDIVISSREALENKAQERKQVEEEVDEMFHSFYSQV